MKLRSSSLIKQLCFFFVFHNLLTKILARQFAAVSKKSCLTDLRVEWSREVGSSAFVGTPVITDVNGDGELDVVVTSFSGEIHVIQAKTGQPLSQTHWPYKLAHSSVQSSPIKFDIDRDGMSDIIVISAEGELTAYTHDGDPIMEKEYQIEPLMVIKDWNHKELSAHKNIIHDFILDNNELLKFKKEIYIPVDPHVLANAVLVDLNQDNVIEELVIPVTYFFDLNFYSTDEGLELLRDVEYYQLKNYLASSLLILNVTSMRPINTLHLELTSTTSEYPGYLLFAPSVADLDSNGGPLEIVVGTSAGQIHAFSAEGKERSGFPIPTDTVHGQVTIEDVNLDGKLELVVADVSGNVGCYDRDGGLLWEAQISGSSTAGSRVADLNHDGRLEIIIAANDGQLWALSGDTGEVVADWPIKVGQRTVAQPLVTRLNGQTYPTVVSLAEDGSLYLIRGHGNCRSVVSLGETSLVPILSHDLIPSIPGLELLVATHDGTLMCLSQKETGAQPDNLPVYACPTELHTPNGFTFYNGKFGVILHRDTGIATQEHTSATFDVTFTVIDESASKPPNSTYKIQIYIGSIYVGGMAYSAPGTYKVTMKSPTGPIFGELLLVYTNIHGQIFTDSTFIRFHMAVLDDVKWLLIGPVIGMSLTLLFVYGFPTSDLLPISLPVKNL